MKKNLALILRGYKVLHSLLPAYMPAAAARAVFAAALPFVNIIAASLIINALVDERDMNYVLYIAVGAAVINFAGAAVMNLLKKVNNIFSHRIEYLCERPLDEKQQIMDYAQIEDPETRRLRQRISTYRASFGHGVTYLAQCFERLITGLLTIILSVFVFAPVLSGGVRAGGFWSFVNAPWLSAVFVVILLGNAVLSMALQIVSMKKTYASISETTNFSNAVFGYISDKLSKYQIGKDLKVNRLRVCVDNMLVSIHDTVDKVIKKWVAIDIRYSTYSSLASNAFSAIVYIFVTVKAVLGNFAVGSIVQYVGGITRFHAGFTTLMSCLAEILENAAALQLYFDFLDKPDKIYHGTIPVEKRCDNEYEIEFRNVSFIYPGTERYALKDLDLKLRIGQRLAVVGMNGSGKTTMIKLLCRLYDPTEGAILLNGIDIRKYDYEEYLGIFSVVFQDFKLFAFPLVQNVAAEVEYDAAKVAECLAKAGVADRVESMPRGLYTPLYKDFDDDGVEISGGEAQKIAIARALYKAAPFIVLDEPTAALDPVAEFEVYSKLNDIVGDRTAIFISHRLSSCRFCNDIAVFHEGRLIQRGGHETLVSDADGKYYELWNAQAQYYVNA